MADVFISYKRERRKAARHLEQILIRHGYSVWFDHALVRGEDWALQIEREIATAKAVIVLWCALSVGSEPVRAEATYAKDERNAKGEPKLIPVKIEACMPPLFLKQAQYIDLTAASCAPRDPGFDPLIDDVERLVGRAPHTDYKALRDYEATWRAMGAFTLAGFPFETVAIPERVLQFSGAAINGSPPGSTAAADDRLFAEVERAGTIEAYQFYLDEFPQGAHAPVVRFRLKAATEQADAERQRQQQAEAKRTAEAQQARLKAEGRIPVTVRDGHGTKDLWPKPGAGETVQDCWEQGGKRVCGPEMVVVPAGRFMMGSSPAEIAALTQEFPQASDYFKWETPQRQVTIAQPFAVGRHAVTFDDWDAALAAGGVTHNPEAPFGRGRQPVIKVSWDDATAYCAWLSKVTGQTYRLLSEAEWEYAARAGTTTTFWWGPQISTDQANYGNHTIAGSKKGEYRQKTVPVDSFQPNPWGLYQVHGNVWEWCADPWHDSYNAAPSDGSVWQGGDATTRVVRGGSWLYVPWDLRSANRVWYSSDYRGNSLGFRVGRLLPFPRTL